MYLRLKIMIFSLLPGVFSRNNRIKNKMTMDLKVASHPNLRTLLEVDACSSPHAHSTNDIYLAREIKDSFAKSENCHWLAWIFKRRVSRGLVQITHYFVTFSPVEVA